MTGPSLCLSSPYGVFALLGADGRCGYCGMDASAPRGMVFHTLYYDPDGDGSEIDLLVEWLACNMAAATELWSGGSRVPVEGITGCSPVEAEGRGYALCGNCEVVLLERDGQAGEARE